MIPPTGLSRTGEVQRLDVHRLSEHFLLEEFAHSDTYPELVVPVPSQYQTALRLLVQTVVEPLRVEFRAPLRVLSGYRSPKLNTAVGGSATSQHLRAEAADLTPMGGRSALALFTLLRARAAAGAPLPHGQVIFYPGRNFVHVALASDRFPHPTFCLHWPARGFVYRVVTPHEPLGPYLDGRAPAPLVTAGD